MPSCRAYAPPPPPPPQGCLGSCICQREQACSRTLPLFPSWSPEQSWFCRAKALCQLAGVQPYVGFTQGLECKLWTALHSQGAPGGAMGGGLLAGAAQIPQHLGGGGRGHLLAESAQVMQLTRPAMQLLPPSPGHPIGPMGLLLLWHMGAARKLLRLLTHGVLQPLLLTPLRVLGRGVKGEG